MRRAASRIAGFMNHPQVDSMIVFAACAILFAIAFPVLRSEPRPLIGTPLVVCLVLAGAAFLVSMGIGFFIAYGAGLTAAGALLGGAAIGFCGAWITGAPAGYRWIALAVGALVAPPVATFVEMRRARNA